MSERKPREKKPVQVQMLSNGLWENVWDVVSTEEGVLWIRGKGQDCIRYRIVTIHFDKTVTRKPVMTEKVTFV